MTHSFQGDAQLWPADLHHQRCRAVSHFATTPGSTRSSRLHMMPWIAVHRRHQNKVQWNRESACKLDWFASWRSEAIIPLSQDPSTGEGDQNFLDPFWAHGHQYSCMSRIKATREAFLHHSSFPFSSSLWQMTGLFQFSDQRHSWRPSDSCSNWMQFGRSCFGIIVVGRPAHSCSKLLDCTLGWTEKDQTAFCRPAAYSGVSMLRYGDPQLVQPISSFDGWNICRCPWSGILCRLAWDLAVEICWNHTGIYLNSKHETHIFCAGVAEMLLHAAGCEQLDKAVQDGMGHNFPVLWKPYMSNSLILVTDVGESWQILQILILAGWSWTKDLRCFGWHGWIVLAPRQKTVAKRATGQWPHLSAGQNRCKSSTSSCHFQNSIFHIFLYFLIFFVSCVMSCGDQRCAHSPWTSMHAFVTMSEKLHMKALQSFRHGVGGELWKPLVLAVNFWVHQCMLYVLVILVSAPLVLLVWLFQSPEHTITQIQIHKKKFCTVNQTSWSGPQEWDLKRRDSKTGVVFPLCQCKQRKIYNTEPALCEMNKFEAWLDPFELEVDESRVSTTRYYTRLEICNQLVLHSLIISYLRARIWSQAEDYMMRHLSRKQDDFSHLVVADVAFDVFTRA